VAAASAETSDAQILRVVEQACAASADTEVIILRRPRQRRRSIVVGPCSLTKRCNCMGGLRLGRGSCLRPGCARHPTRGTGGCRPPY
jgi:hypothetical protein